MFDLFLAALTPVVVGVWVVFGCEDVGGRGCLACFGCADSGGRGCLDCFGLR